MSEAAGPLLAGRLEGRRHVLAVRVYYEDTDFSGVVYHASYLRFCERGRSDFLRLAGIHHAELASEGLAFAVRRMEIDFRQPARIDDVLEVETRLAGVGAASLKLEQRVLRQGRPLVEAHVQAVLVAGARPRRLSDEMRDLLVRAGGIQAA